MNAGKREKITVLVGVWGGLCRANSMIEPENLLLLFFFLATLEAQTRALPLKGQRPVSQSADLELWMHLLNGFF